MKETRFFHVFNHSSNNNDPVTIHMAVSWKELSLAAGANGSSIPLSKSVLRNPNELSEKLPVVNDQYKIPQYVTLQLSPAGESSHDPTSS